MLAAFAAALVAVHRMSTPTCCVFIATSVDGFHPSPIGYGFWADALAPAVTG